MFVPLFRWSALALLVAAVTFTFSAPPAEAQTGRYLYTVGNSLLVENAVFGFEILADGRLQPLPGSPYATGGGVGQGTPPFTQNGLVSALNGRFLLATNLFSSDISIYRVRRNGRLVLENVVSTGGFTPASIAIHNDLVYVSHLGTSFDACYFCDYRGYRFDPTIPDLIPIPDSIIELPLNPPGFALAIQFTPDGSGMIGTRITEGKIDSFKVDPVTGLLAPAPGSPYNTEDTQPIGFAFNPVNPTQLFVSNVVELDAQPGTMSSYLMAQTGQLAPIPGGPFTTGGEGAACWVVLTSDGKNLYTTNTRSDSITRYTVAEDGTLNFVEVIPVPKIDNLNDEPLDMVITPDDQFLYTINGGVAGIVGYRILPDGGLQLLPGPQPLALPNTTAPYGLVYVER